MEGGGLEKEAEQWQGTVEKEAEQWQGTVRTGACKNNEVINLQAQRMTTIPTSNSNNGGDNVTF